MQYTIKQARLLSGKTQKDMAKCLNMHVQTYRKIEENPDRVTIGQARTISECTGIPYDQLFLMESLLIADKRNALHKKGERR